MNHPLCTDHPGTFDHIHHQRCYQCGVKVPVPLELKGFANSTLCPKCRELSIIDTIAGSLS